MKVYFVLLMSIIGFGNECSSQDLRRGGPSCGVLCVRGSFELLSKQPPTTIELFQSKYFNSPLGSTAQQLVDAIHDHGLAAESFKNMAVRGLSRLKTPAILHVSDANAERPYSHWVLCAGTKDKNLRIIDFPRDTTLISPGMLASIWDGTGILVYDTPQSQPIELYGWLFWEVLPLLSGVVVALAVCSVAISRVDFMRRSYTSYHIGSLLALTMMVVLWRHVGCADGFARNIVAVNRTIKTLRPLEARRVRYAGDLVGQLGSETLVIDCRIRRDFEAGHLPGALNLPVTIDDSELTKQLSGHPFDREIVVYCQSAGCPFSDQMVRRISLEGFSNLAVYTGGWRDWVSKLPDPESSELTVSKD